MKNLLSRERHLSSFKNCLNNVLFLSNYTLKQYFQSTSSRSQHRTVSPTITGWPSIRNQRLKTTIQMLQSTRLYWNFQTDFKGEIYKINIRILQNSFYNRSIFRSITLSFRKGNKSIYLMFCCWEWKEQWWMCKYSTYSRRLL